MRDIIEFNAELDGKKIDFKIYAEATMLEKQKIENIVASFVGGHKELIKLKQEVELSKESIKENRDKKEIFVNPLDLFITDTCDESINRGYWYGTLKVLLVNPPIDIDECSSENFDKIVSALGSALHSFQSRDKTATSKVTDK
jgi:hypothetical protein